MRKVNSKRRDREERTKLKEEKESDKQRVRKGGDIRIERESFK